MAGIRQVAIISGKGGTGKTTVAASLVSIMARAGRRVVVVDADTDAPNLHVILKGKTICRETVKGPPIARLNAVSPEKGRSWEDVCVFGAIEGVKVDSIRCVGCRVCEICAPPGGVRMEDRISGEMVVEEFLHGSFLHGRLLPGGAGFGGFVYRLRSRAEEIAMESDIEFIMIDGAPGIGCPVIASISGCDSVLIVAEPTESGWHDFLRVHELCSRMGVTVAVCVNRHDINPSFSDRIENFCMERSLFFAGRVPFDESVMSALDEGKNPVEACPVAPASLAMKYIAEKLGLVESGANA